MSIRDEIRSRVGEGRLWLLTPAMSSEPCIRLVFVTLEVKEFVCGPWENTQDAIRAMKLRAHIDLFSAGKPITISNDPYRKPNTTYMSPIHPKSDRVFEIRNQDKPGVRVFGSFAEKDVFIATTWNYRKYLGGPTDSGFRDMRERSKATWKQLFNSYQPLLGVDRNDLSSNIISV